MKVSDLIAQLEELDEDAEILLGLTDDDGNPYAVGEWDISFAEDEDDENAVVMTVLTAADEEGDEEEVE